MSLKRGWRASALLLLCWMAAARADGPAEAGPACGPGGCANGACATGGCAMGVCATGNCSSGACGSWFHCCPKVCFPLEKPPCIKFHCVCPKPVCEPCDLEGYGYYPTCWRPFAYPPNYGYCPAPPPGVVASAPPPMIGGPPGPATPGVAPDETLPSPKKAANPNPDR